MGLGDLFKRSKKEEEIRTDYDIYSMEMGYLVDYDFKSWEVVEVTEYDWGNNFLTREYTLDCGTEKIFLHVDESEEKCSVSKEAKLNEIDPQIKLSIFNTDQPANQIAYQGKIYTRLGENTGECHELGSDDWSKLVNWEFLDDTETHFISVDRWGENDITGATGKYVDVNEFSNILPRA